MKLLNFIADKNGYILSYEDFLSNQISKYLISTIKGELFENAFHSDEEVDDDEPTTTYIDLKNPKKSVEGVILDEMNIHKYCCRRMMISNVHMISYIMIMSITWYVWYIWWSWCVCRYNLMLGMCSSKGFLF